MQALGERYNVRPSFGSWFHRAVQADVPRTELPAGCRLVADLSRAVPASVDRQPPRPDTTTLTSCVQSDITQTNVELTRREKERF